ncbi:MAG: putative ABC transporter permease [bacterium]|nr:putative ABC transporter permease [bacterium]
MWDMKILGISFYLIMNYLIIYSVVGWIWESCFVSVQEHKLVNRGYVTGPVCTIYGVGATALYLLLRPFSGNYILLFFVGAIVATVLEYVTAVVMEAVFHTSWWDYTNQKFNYKGRICLSSTIGWGAGSVLLFVVLQPAVNWIVALYSEAVGKILIIIIAIVYAVDFTFATIAAADLSKKLAKMDALFDEFTEYVKSSRIYEAGEDIYARIDAFRQQYSGMNYFSKFSKRMDVRQAVFNEQLSKLGLTNHTDDVKERVAAYAKKLNAVFTSNRFQQGRIMKAYPHLKTHERISADRLRSRLYRKTKNEDQQN